MDGGECGWTAAACFQGTVVWGMQWEGGKPRMTSTSSVWTQQLVDTMGLGQAPLTITPEWILLQNNEIELREAWRRNNTIFWFFPHWIYRSCFVMLVQVFSLDKTTDLVIFECKSVTRIPGLNDLRIEFSGRVSQLTQIEP